MTVTEDAPAAAPASSEPTAPAPAATGLAVDPRHRRPQGRRADLARRVARCTSCSPASAAIWVVRAADRRRAARHGRARLLRPGLHLPLDRRRLPVPPAAHHRPGHARRAAPGRARPPSPSPGRPRRPPGPTCSAAAWSSAAYAIDGGALGDDTDGVRLFIAGLPARPRGAGRGLDLHRHHGDRPPAHRHVAATRARCSPGRRSWPAPCGSSRSRCSPVSS